MLNNPVMPSHLRHILDLRKLVIIGLLVGNSLLLNRGVSVYLEVLSEGLKANEKSYAFQCFNYLAFNIVLAPVCQSS